jgi:hypothetical protein
MGAHFRDNLLVETRPTSVACQKDRECTSRVWQSGHFGERKLGQVIDGCGPRLRGEIHGRKNDKSQRAGPKAKHRRLETLQNHLMSLIV